jgi:hypothetical protein
MPFPERRCWIATTSFCLQPELGQNSDFLAHHIFDLNISLFNGGMWGARQTAGAIEVME